MRRARSAVAVRVAVVGVFVGLAASACGGGGAASSGTGSPGRAVGVSGEVVVFAAASLTDAFAQIGDEFAAENPRAHVTYSFAASSELAAQIVEGAPVDVYASADLDNMARVTDAGAADGDPAVFASNSLAIVVEKGNPRRITGVADLADRDLVVVTCAPEVPCGRYATEIFDDAGVTVTADSYEENVKAVVTKVALGEADAGIAYVTDIAVAADRVDGVAIPAASNVTAHYPIVVTADAPDPAGGRAFVEFVTGDTAQGILSSFGFGPP